MSFETSSPSTNINMPDSDMQMESVDIKLQILNLVLSTGTSFPKIEESNDKIGNISNALKSILNGTNAILRCHYEDGSVTSRIL